MGDTILTQNGSYLKINRRKIDSHVQTVGLCILYEGNLQIQIHHGKSLRVFLDWSP